MIFRWISKWLVLFSFCCALPVGAQTTWPAGEYLSDGGWGTLLLKPATQGRQAFGMDTMGANGHSCTLEGVISNGRAELPVDEQGNACIVSFSAKNGRILVEPVSTPGRDDHCRYFCGARAGFSGEYAKPAAGCDTASLQKTRATFKQQYDRKDYAAAERTLAPVLQRCKRTLFWLTDLSIRNDLALTQAKLGNGVACRQTLKPLAADAARYTGDDQQARRTICERDANRYLPPTDCDNYLPLVSAAKVNLQWCARAKK